MKISVISATELNESLTSRWDQLQRSNDTLRSPYYRPEFTQLVCALGQDVRVALIEDQGAVQGFFPHQTGPWGKLGPVAGSLNDYHGLVCDPELDVDAGELLKACGARYFNFNHMPMTQRTFAPHVRVAHVSPVLDLAGGWEAYVQRLALLQKKATPGIISAVRKSAARFERDVGPLRFVPQVSDGAVLDTLMVWKSDQRARTVGSAGDPFAVPWIRRFMHQLLERQASAFGGDLCALYAGDSLVACHFGLRHERTLHSWFPVYTREHAIYQPGLIMYMRLAQASCDFGLDLIDMGRGSQDYKLRMATRTIAMGEGLVSRPQMFGDAFMMAKQGKAKLSKLRRDLRARGAKAPPKSRPEGKPDQ